MTSKIDRRTMLKAIPALMAAPRVMMQTQNPSATSPIRLRKLQHFALNVSDVQRSVDFYQGLFGMPIQARRGSTIYMRIGAGPQFFTISPAGTKPPAIVSRVGLTVENFNADRVFKLLNDRKVPAKLVMDGNTPELSFDDPDGIAVHLVDPTYCGGSGPLGNVCRNVEPSPKKGVLAVRDLSHFTIAVSNAERSTAFYQELLGLKAQAHQGPTAPVMGIGDRIQFLMFTGGAGARGGAPPRPANINHVCMNMDQFNVDNILKTLEGYGIKPRGDATQGAAGPLVSYVSLRMPNRGGAEGGTPELYFTDPDGLLLQLQDVTYCGGGGYLGSVCAE